ncbi:hypothetical protein BDZ89DRAFT_1057185 [Hymenopellis radicata]|nr:hypothetical protein BDZ89DRAFT_1057185 [Hymenopellis radicata]
MVWQIEERIQNEESGPAVFDYIADDAVFAIDGRVLDAHSKPTLKDYMKNNYHPWATFEMKDVKVVPTGLMAATVCYRANATKIVRDDQPPEKYNVVCSSSWRQEASADWILVSHCEGFC